jgi:hypothetical protein
MDGGEMRYLIAKVDSLNYESTPIGLRRQLSRREGIEDVKVDEASGTATIRYDESHVRADRVRWYIAESGYTCYPSQDDVAAERTSSRRKHSPRNRQVSEGREVNPDPDAPT